MLWSCQLEDGKVVFLLIFLIQPHVNVGVDSFRLEAVDVKFSMFRVKNNVLIL